MVLKEYLSFYPLEVCESFMLPWQPEFQSNHPINLMQPFPIPDDFYMKFDHNWSTDSLKM